MTSKKIAALKPLEKRYVVSDGHGLTLRVHPTGTKTWVLRISFNGRVSDVTLGRFPEISLLQARQIARRKKKELGQEPPKGYTLKDAFRLWCDLKRGRIVSYKDEKRRIERYVMSYLGTRQIDEITAPLVIHTVKTIEKAGHLATLKRVLMRTREILDLAVCAGFIQHNPIERVSRVFPSPIVKSMPSVHWSELPKVFEVFNGAPLRTQTLFLWSCLSLLRPMECVKVRYDWIEDDVLTIPASEMKKGRDHRLPLSALSVRVLDFAKSISLHPKSIYIFAGRSPGSHMSEQTIAKYLHETSFKNRLVAHGIRSIGRSWFADHEYPFEASEACLSHVVGSSVSRAYQRSDYLSTRRAMMEDWSTFIRDCAKSACFLPQVIEIKGDYPS